MKYNVLIDAVLPDYRCVSKPVKWRPLRYITGGHIRSIIFLDSASVAGVTIVIPANSVDLLKKFYRFPAYLEMILSIPFGTISETRLVVNINSTLHNNVLDLGLE